MWVVDVRQEGQCWLQQTGGERTRGSETKEEVQGGRNGWGRPRGACGWVGCEQSQRKEIEVLMRGFRFSVGRGGEAPCDGTQKMQEER